MLVLSCGGTASLREGSGGSTTAGDANLVQAGASVQAGTGNLAAGGGLVAGGGGRMGTDGMTMGSGGISADASGGARGGTGAGGMPGTGGAATGGAATGGEGMGGANLREVADALDGLRLDSPCGTNLGGNVCLYPGRLSDDGTPFSAMVAATMGGTPGTPYQVALHIRGVTGMTHVMGGVPGSSDNLVIGGTRYGDGTNEASFEQWRITTSSPSQHYYVNVTPSGLSHVCILIDMVELITIDGGSMLTIDVYDGNSHQISNTIDPPLAPSGVPGSMSSGQFIQINVDSVTM